LHTTTQHVNMQNTAMYNLAPCFPDLTHHAVKPVNIMMPLVIKHFLELQVGTYKDFPLCSYFNPLQYDNALSRTLLYTAPGKLKDNKAAPLQLEDIKVCCPCSTRSEPVHCKVQASTTQTSNYICHSIEATNAPLLLLEASYGREPSRPV